jgi:hypothetical protein
MTETITDERVDLVAEALWTETTVVDLSETQARDVAAASIKALEDGGYRVTNTPLVTATWTVDARCTDNGCLDRKEPEYLLLGNCANCKAHGIVGRFTRKHEAGSRSMGPRCPNCGCCAITWISQPEEGK